MKVTEVDCSKIKVKIERGFHLGPNIVDVKVYYDESFKGNLVAETFVNGESLDILITELNRMKAYIIKEVLSYNEEK